MSPYKGKKTIYLDLDGVCVDWMSAFLKVVNDPNMLSTWPKGKKYYDIKPMPIEEYARIMKEQGSKFWANLKPYPWFKDMYDALSEIGDVCFLTSPGRESSAPTGKMEWFQETFGKEFDSFIITKQKHRLANLNSVLIDDTEAMINAFVRAGGKGILFPAPWNNVIEPKPEEYPAYIVQRVLEEFK